LKVVWSLVFEVWGFRPPARRSGIVKSNLFQAKVSVTFSVEESDTIACPYCGQFNEVVVDTSLRSQRFTTDCEVCCRPFEVTAECEAGEILSLDVQGG
jgi:transposase-like protein